MPNLEHPSHKASNLEDELFKVGCEIRALARLFTSAGSFDLSASDLCGVGLILARNADKLEQLKNREPFDTKI